MFMEHGYFCSVLTTSIIILGFYSTRGLHLHVTAVFFPLISCHLNSKKNNQMCYKTFNLFFSADYMNHNGVSNVTNPVYQHARPPRSLLPTISSDDTESEYLNYFKNRPNGPEYLNELPPSTTLPFDSSNMVCVDQSNRLQNSIDNPDYQQDFTPTPKTHANGHIPAAENVEYLGPD